jgi:probable HAF family extracellular repeat protein
LSEIKAAPDLALILVSPRQLKEIPVQTASRLSLLALATLSSAPLSAQAAPDKSAYQPVALVPFTPGQGSGVATAINDHGTVCGLWTGPTGAFCWRDGQLTELQPLPGDDNVAVDSINARGHAVGLSQSTATFRRHAVVFIDGVAQEVAIPQATGATASGIDNAGDIVGAYTGRDGLGMAFLYRDGVVHDLGALGQTVRSSGATGINDRQQIVGNSLIDVPTDNGGFETRGFLYQHGAMTALPG